MLLQFLNEMQQKSPSKVPLSSFVYVSDTPDGILSYFRNYQVKELVDKFI